MRAGEGELPEARAWEPAAGSDNGPVVAMDMIGFHRDAIACDGMFERAQRLDPHRSISEELPCGLLRVGFAWRHLNIRELPQMRVNQPGRSLLDEQTATVLGHKRNEMAPGDTG